MAHVQTVARPYAQAIFDLTREDDKAQAHWQAFLEAAAQFIADESVAQQLKHPGFLAELSAWLALWLTRQGCEPTDAQEQNLLHLLHSHHRLELLPAIASQYAALCIQSHQRVDVSVISAQALSDDEIAQLRGALEQKWGKAVVLETSVAPELLAGVVLQYDGQVVDQSLKGRLEQFARQLND